MTDIFKKIIFGEILTRFFLPFDAANRERLNPEYFRWLNDEIPKLADEFIQTNKILESDFVKGLNKSFQTHRFNFFASRCVLEYMIKLSNLLNDSLADSAGPVVLEDNAIHRFAVERFAAKFKISPKVQWKRSGLGERLAQIFWNILFCLAFSLKNGLTLRGPRESYKVMREAVWGLYDVGGYYFHDDFLVDSEKIKQKSFLLFSRSIPKTGARLKGYEDARRSPYAHFNLQKLSLGVKPFFGRVIPRYILASSGLLWKELPSGNFTLFRAIFLYFAFYALAYERIFSHYRVTSELGHCYFASNHIAEAIICENYGTRYYLMHWSDFSIESNRWTVSNLGCDKYLTWGKIHVQGLSTPYVPTGYVFKRFICDVAQRKESVLAELGLPNDRRVVSFFDESFDEICEMTPQHFVNFWRTAYQCALENPNVTVLIKPKAAERFQQLPRPLKAQFEEIRQGIKRTTNFYILDEKKYCFIEAIGVADIVVSQGMTSSSTIAIICGIEGLYLDEVGYGHPFAKHFKDKIVFADPEKLLNMIKKILIGNENPCSSIPAELLREYDEYNDDRGIDRFREILAAGA